MASVVVNGDTSGAVTLSPPAVAGTVTVTLPSASGTMAVLPTATGVLAESAGGTGTTTGYYGFKNRLINSAMVIDQRNAGASVTVDDSAVYTVDRWQAHDATDGAYTAQQSSTAPAGFVKSLLVTVTSADTSLGASQYAFLIQQIEGFNIADLGWGTANAQTVTISFWVRSSLTGTFGGALRNSAGDRGYPFTYTISAANTFEQKTVTITGDTTGTWLTTNGAGIGLVFGLGAGSTFSGTAGAWAAGNIISATGAVSVIGTNGATFYITGVQLEKGSTATSFDYRPIGTELALCQRYALKYNTDALAYAVIGNGFAANTTTGLISLPLPVQMRTIPTVTASTLMVQDGVTVTAVTSITVVTNQTNSQNAYIQFVVASGLTAFRPYQLQTNNSTSGNLLLSAEL
jgi:hypothetical protein